MIEPAMADVLSETAAALGWCVGIIEGAGKPTDVPTWVRNALSSATRPAQEAETRAHLRRLAGDRRTAEFVRRACLCGDVIDARCPAHAGERAAGG